MRKTCLEMVHELARSDERVIFLGSDLSPGLLQEMRDEYPGRHHMEGIAEANLVGMAAGYAMEGFIPYINTIATFLTRRCYEQVAVDLCLHNLPVRLIANGGGLVYAPLGPTHEAIEDIAIMRALPNMTVVAPADATEMRRFMHASLDWPGPIYIRMAKGGDPVITQGIEGFEIGRAYPLRQTGGDVLLIGTGVASTEALAAAEALSQEGIGCDVLHIPTVKPLDFDTIRECAAGKSLVVTVEEHVLAGGLGSSILETWIDQDAGPLPRFRRIGIPDRFAKDYGNQAHLMQSFGIDAQTIGDTVRQVLR